MRLCTGYAGENEPVQVSVLPGGWEPDALNDGAVPRVGVQRVEGRLVLDVEDHGGVLADSFLERGEGLLFVSEQGVGNREIDGRDVVFL